MTASDKEVGTERGALLWRVSLLFLWMFSFLHILALPIIISTDGRNYIWLSHLFFEEDFFEKWNYFRTPLYPLFLRLSFVLLGEHSDSLEFVNTFMLASGITLLGYLLKRYYGNITATLSVIFLMLYPGLVGFSHVALTEVGSFFFLSLVLFVTLWPLSKPMSKKHEVFHAVVIGLAITLSYYFRQSVLYTTLPIVVVSLYSAFCKNASSPSIQKEQTRLSRFIWRGFLALIIVIFAYVPTLAWKHFGGDQSFAKVILTYGLIKQQVVDPEDPIFDELPPSIKTTYVDAIKEQQEMGTLGLSGLKAAPVKTVFKAFKKKGVIPDIYSYILKYPKRYAEGVSTSLLFFFGLPGFESQITWWSSLAFTVDGGRVTGDHPRLKKRFRSGTSRSALADSLIFLFPYYQYAVILGGVCCLIYFGLSLFTGHLFGLYFCSVPLFYILLHSGTCLTIDRYVLPIQAFLLACIFLLPAHFVQNAPQNNAPKNEEK